MDSLGDPTFFMTNSHADTYCPYLAKYIKVHAQIADGAVDDPECSHLSKNGLYGVKLRNIIKYPLHSLVVKFAFRSNDCQKSSDRLNLTILVHFIQH